MAADVTVTARINYNGTTTAVLSELTTELIPIVVTVNGVASTAYTVALSNYGDEPAGSFLTPDSAGTSLGVLVGPGSSYVIGAGSYQAWIKYVADPETVVMRAEGWFQVTGSANGGLPPGGGGGGGGAVDSVNTRTGAVVLTKADVGLSNVDNTSDATERAATATLTNKTISGSSNTLTNIAEASVTGLTSDLAGKAATSHAHAEADVTSLTADLAAKAATSTQVIAGTGLTGGGTLAADRTLTVAYGTTSGTATQGNDSRVTGAAQKSSNLSDLSSASTARTNLGLAAVAASGAYSDLTGTVPTAALPPLAISETTVVASQAAMLALTAERGDVAVRSDTGKTYILASDSPTTLADWKEILATGQVVSVAGRTGVVSLTKSDVGLGNVDNTSDAAKPVSTATQTALDAKQPLDSDLTAVAAIAPTNDDLIQRKAGAWTNRTPAQVKTDLALTKSDVGLGNVDNTSNATERAATATLTNKTISGASNTLSSIPESAVTGLVSDLAGKQAGDQDLTDIAALSPTNDDLLQRKAGAWTNRTAAQVKTDLSLTKSDVGLGSVDNTSDAGKPVSTAQQTALDLKAPLASPALTGTPTAPTAAAATNTTQVATTAFVIANAGSTPDADASTKGKVQLAGDLGGTAASPTVPGLTGKVGTARTITAGSGLTGGGDLSADRTLAASYGTPGASAVGDSAAAGSATTVAHSDHVHGREAFATAGSSAVGDTVSAGSATTVSHSDHRHGREAFGNVTANSGYNTSSANGTATTVSHSDHNHGLPAIAESDVTSLVTDLAAKAPLASPTFTGTPAAPTATAATASTQIATTAYADTAATDDIQVFTSASGTWTKPAWVVSTSRVEIIVIGDGGGGASGCRRTSGANRSGGGAGSAAGMSRVVYPASALASTMTIAVGQGGAGGAAKTTDNADGAAGSAGTGSSVTSAGAIVAYAFYGQGGQGGVAGGATSGGGTALGGMFAGSTGGSAAAGSAGSTSNAAAGASGGGGGGGISTGDASFNGGFSGVAHSVSSAQSSAGVAGGASPTTAVNQAVGTPAPGTGGGGGASSTTATAQTGAVGGRYGGGGGGGGASQNGFNSGAGGAGAPGIVYIITKK